MPTPLMDALCSPADMCLLARRDVVQFLQGVRASALGADDQRAVDQLLCLVEDSLGFQVFEAIEAVKRGLSDRLEAELSFDYPGIEIRETISRTEFEGYTEGIVTTILARLDATLAASGLDPGDVDLVCSTGGTARVRVLADGLRTRFGADKLVRLQSLHSVVEGLGERARLLPN